MNKASRSASRVRRIAAVGQVLGALESLANARHYRRDGLLRGPSRPSSRFAQRFPMLVKTLDSQPAALTNQIVRLASGLITIFSPAIPTLRTITAGSNVLTGAFEQRRNPFGRDGSDQMQQVINTYDLVSAAAEPAKRDDLFLRALNTQLAVSYTASGLVKLVSSDWRSGRAFGKIMRTRTYGDERVSRLVDRFPPVGKLVSWLTIAWESLFPTSYFLPRRFRGLVDFGMKSFHILIGVFMGLPRFIWAFLAIHPAVDYVNHEKDRGIAMSALERRLVLALGAGVGASAAFSSIEQHVFSRLRSKQVISATAPDGIGGAIEHQFRKADHGSRGVVVFENGLGAAMEGWDWVASELSMDYDTLTYHRSGYGATTSVLPPEQLVSSLLTRYNSIGSPLILVGHSIGGLVARLNLSRNVGLRNQAVALILIDSTDENGLQGLAASEEKIGSIRQSLLIESLGSALGTSGISGALNSEVDYRRSVHRVFTTFARNRSTIRRAGHEFTETISATQSLALRTPIPTCVISAQYGVSGEERHKQDQLRIAERLDAEYAVVAGASHRSIIGMHVYAREPSRLLRSFLESLEL
ncbi:hypothetical protein ACIFOC_00848 [Leucobacter aridicollis]